MALQPRFFLKLVLLGLEDKETKSCARLTYLGFKKMKKWYLIIAFAVLAMAFASCSAPKYMALPNQVSCPVIQNTCSFGIQNMDQKAKVENSKLTCHYKDFDVQYTISDGFILSLTIINNSNKDLLVDKTKCFVMYNGNATQLFKDARMTGSTTFNDVTGATNISTSHGRVMMIIPSYSKWSPTLNETNLRATEVPSFMLIEGLHHLTVYDNPEVVEFSFEYSYDNKQAKWGSCRNKLYVNTVDVKHGNIMVTRRPNYRNGKTYSEYSWDYIDACGYNDPTYSKKVISSSEYRSILKKGEPDFSEVKRIDAINQQLFKKHNTQVVIGRIVGGVITLPTIIGPVLFWMTAAAGCIDSDHQPPK